MIASAVCGLSRRGQIDDRPPVGVWTVAGRYDRDGISSSALNRGNSSGDEAKARALMGRYGATFVFEEATASGCALVIFMSQPGLMVATWLQRMRYYCCVFWDS